MKSPFLSFIREHMLARHYAIRTIDTYLYWIKYYINFNHKTHPAKLGEQNVEAFLTYLSVDRNVAISTQGIALNAIVYLYREIVKSPLSMNMNFTKSKRATKLPTVLTTSEVKKLLTLMPVAQQLLAKLMYRSGLRLMEAIRLRVKDVDFTYHTLSIFNAKGGKHRRVTLARELTQDLKDQMNIVKKYFEADKLNPQYAGVYLPNALNRKYPNAPYQLLWHYLFPSGNVSIDPRANLERRHHVDETTFQKAIRRTAIKAGIEKTVSKRRSQPIPYAIHSPRIYCNAVQIFVRYKSS